MNKAEFYSNMAQKGICVDQNQKQMIENGNSLRIIAGPGSGKTTVICMRAAYLILVEGVDAGRICMITFTRKAAAEMKERLDFYLGYESRACVGTFHSIYHRMVKYMVQRYPEVLEMVVLGDINDTLIQSRITEIVQRTGLRTIDVRGNNLYQLLSKCVNMGLDKKACCKLLTSDKEDEEKMLSLLDEIQKIKIEEKVMSFDDILINFKNMLECPFARDAVSNMFDYFFVDEFQDINAIQFETLCKVLDQRHRVAVVGDDDQSIYAFRGGSNEFFRSIDQRFELETYYLMMNYRCKYKNIIQAVNTLIACNGQYRLDKPAIRTYSQLENKSRLCIKKLENQYQQSLYVIESIFQTSSLEQDFYVGMHRDDRGEIVQIQEKNQVPNLIKYTILYRNKYQSEAILGELIRQEIPFIVEGDYSELVGVFANPLFYAGYRAWGQLVEDSRETLFENWYEVLKDICRQSYRKLDGFDKLFWSGKINWNNENQMIEEFVKFYENTATAANGNKEEMINYLKEIIDFSTSNDKKMEKLLKTYIRLPKYNSYILGMGWSCEEYYSQVLEEYGKSNFAYMTINYQKRTKMYKLNQERIKSANEGMFNGVRLMSIHKSKGLTLEYVYLVGCEAKVLPGKTAVDECELSKMTELQKFCASTIQEERRLMYVAMTRCREKLCICYVDEPSEFIAELGVES